MKRCIALLCAISFALAVTGCAKKENRKPAEPAVQESIAEPAGPAATDPIPAADTISGPEPAKTQATETSSGTKQESAPAAPKVSSNARLASLVTSEGVLKPAFTPDTTEYAVILPYETTSITVKGRAANGKATISADDGAAKELSVGENAVAITVTAESGAVKTYTVTVTRQRGDNANLAKLNLSAGTLNPSFSPDTTEYSVTVPNEIAEFTASGTAAEAKANVGGDSGLPKKISVGANAVDVTVTARDGSTVKTYAITVTRASSNKASLASLAMSTGTLMPPFSPDTTSYTVNVPNGVTEITATGKIADAKSSMAGSSGVPQKLAVGANKIEISVTAEDGATTKTYAITVRRNGSGNANLKSLTVSAGTLAPAFSANTTEYALNVPYGMTEFTISGIPVEAKSTMSANNGKPQRLSVGTNAVRISAISEDGGTEKIYTVNVRRYGFEIPMIAVPAGSFRRTDENAASKVSAFRMGAREITREEFLKVMETDPSAKDASTGTKDPVQNVNWYHAIAFCNKLSINEGYTPAYAVKGVDFATLTWKNIPRERDATWDAVTVNWNTNGYRLPTETEWMWAAMGATANGYAKAFAGAVEPNTDKPSVSIDAFAWYKSNSGKTAHPAGTKKPNELGLYDMSGNVWEWCGDWYGAYRSGTQTDYRGPGSGSYRIVRGGSWLSEQDFCTIACRYSYSPFDLGPSIGFRVVRR
jgi:formylglycine-generating enzyme required for sulfatase activity